MLQDDNMYPKDIFLQHCLQFSKSNFGQNTITVEEYKITQQNLDDKVFFKESQQKNKNEEEQDYYDEDYSRGYRRGAGTSIKTGMAGGYGDDPATFEDEYDILDIKIFPEVVIVNGK